MITYVGTASLYVDAPTETDARVQLEEVQDVLHRAGITVVLAETWPSDHYPVDTHAVLDN